jgi:predicted nucleic acid-binding protein
MLLRGRIDVDERGRMFDRAMTMLAENLTIVTEREYGQYEAEARDRIPRDPNDWPAVALALQLGIGIWTVDDDFFGCGVPVWTTETLLTHLKAGRARLDV